MTNLSPDSHVVQLQSGESVVEIHLQASNGGGNVVNRI